MRRDVMLLGFVAGVFLLAALLSPPVYWAGEWAAQRWPKALSFADQPFSRYVSRIAMAAAIVGLIPLARALRARPADVGISRPQFGRLLRGLILALFVLGAFVTLAFAFDARSWRPNVGGGRIAKSALMAAAGAVIAAPVEELIFRGVLFGMLRRQNRWKAALIISSAIFALVHFLHKPGGIESVRWFSGFETLARMAMPQPSEQWLAQAANLALCGAILAWAYQRTGTLWFSIGLHAGWIFWLKLANTVTLSSAAQAPLWGTRKVVDGWGATVALAVTALLVPWLARADRNPRHEPHPSSAIEMG
jgi:membrane protease YdiL (CAAX protease family)